MRFGLYLKQSGVISAEQLVAAMEVQQCRLVPIGQLALEEGMLAVRQIFNILRAQKDSPYERFGDMAMEMGLLSRDDIMRLLMIQADRQRPIAEILVEQGVLAEQQLEAELAAYRQAQQRPQRASATMKFVPMLLSRDVPRTVAETVTAV